MDLVADLNAELGADGLVPPAPPPVDRPLPTLQALVALRRNALAAWPRDAYRDPIMGRPFLGKTNYIVNDPEGIRHVLVDNTANYRRSPASIRILRPILGDGVLLSEGERWRHARRIMSPSFRPETVLKTAPVMAAAIDEALDPLDVAPDRPVDVLAAMQNLTLDIAARALFSADMKRFGAALRRLSLDYGARLEQPYPLDFLLPVAIPSPMDLRRLWFRRKWTRLIDAIIADRARRPVPSPDLFDVLTAPDSGMDAAQVRDEIATLLVAGHETTALALFWAFYLMARAPRCQEAVAREAARHDLSAAGATEAIPRLAAARAVVDEALRLYPPAFTIVRAAIGADEICGQAVEPGALVFVAPWLLQRHERLWDRPAAFDPGRFLPGAEPPPRYAYMPFGAGPRVCLGAQFALTEATLVVAKIAARFRVAPADDGPVNPVAVVTTRPDRALPFRLEPR